MKTRLAAVMAQTALWLTASPASASAQAPDIASTIPPAEIVRAVETELFADDGVESSRIRVGIADGIVTLSGNADNLLTKIRAAQRAQRVKGVRAVINRIRVELEPLPDLEIERAISTALREDPAVEAFQIGVESANGAVTLTGAVDSWAEKELAGIVASSVRGVRDLRNTIEVQPPLQREDEELRSEIVQRLRWDMYVDDGLIAVDVSDGRVKLDGTVGSAAEKRRAISDAYVEGVLYVDAEELEVAFWAREERLRKDKYAFMTEEAIAGAVRDALRHDPRVEASGLSVTMQNRTAVLSGDVSNLRARRAAAKTAANVVGVWSVTNNLRVRPSSTPSDQTIRTEIRRKMLYDPDMSGQEIAVTADGGKVSLYGSVATEFDKDRAEDLAASVNGVVDVANYLILSSLEVRPEKSDWEIREEIESELFWSPFVDSEDVTVTVEDGVATLTGVVDTGPEREAAGNNALDGGAIAVDNNLRVRNRPVR